MRRRSIRSSRYIDRRAVRHFGFQLSPIAQPAALTDCLQARHLRPTDNWAKVYRTTAQPIEIHTDLCVEVIGREHAADFGRVACAASGMPSALQPWLENLVSRANWQTYLAFAAAELAANGALFVRGG